MHKKHKKASVVEWSEKCEKPIVLAKQETCRSKKTVGCPSALTSIRANTRMVKTRTVRLPAARSAQEATLAVLHRTPTSNLREAILALWPSVLVRAATSAEIETMMFPG